MAQAFSHGTVHQAGEDMQAALTADAGVLALWENLTPLARNEFICWIDSAKREPTRVKRVAWMVDSLK